jgi:phenylalanyl-tRNA synthetase beta chain
MIITKHWLYEWLELGDISTDEICKALNAIGLEVDSEVLVRIPKGVKIGFVKACEKHPDADKLNVCQVDLGDEVTQIVCGAKNVAAGQYVPVATIGAVLGDDFKIKKAKLRGVESNGMICSSTEIGLPKMNDGILVLDESIGELILGKELREYPLLNDDIIDIELTANRGDCLSIHGVSRDLSAALDVEKKKPNLSFKEDHRGVSRVLKLEVENSVECSVEYKFIEIKELKLPFLYAFRLACVENLSENDIADYLSYATHSTGVLLRAYPWEDEVTLSLKKNELGFDALYQGDKELSVIGINQNRDIELKDEKYIIVEASYIDPDIISQKKSESDIKTDDLFYKSSRGSESDISFGMDYLCSKLSEKNDLSVYRGSQTYKVETPEKIVKIEHKFINDFIGEEIEPTKITEILSHLGFSFRAVDNVFAVTIPPYRTDVKNRQDIIEELVRIIGIDNIKSEPLAFKEARRLGSSYESYKKRIHFRDKAAGIGFFEAVHYFFDNLFLMQKYGITSVKDELDVANPITKELNTLRTTLLLHAINSSSRNIKFGKRSVKLFEIGRVVDENRVEQNRISFIFSGEVEAPSVNNHGKPKEIDFFEFSKMISQVVGEFELQKAEDKNLLVSPYEYARVIIDGKDAGFIGRAHVSVEEEFDLPRTYICELDFDMLVYERVIVKAYSKFPALSRDLSLLVPKSMKFSEIREHLNSILPDEVISFAPIDIYESEELGDNLSVTVKFHIQSFEHTLEDEQITAIMQNITDSLKEKFGIMIR